MPVLNLQRPRPATSRSQLRQFHPKPVLLADEMLQQERKFRRLNLAKRACGFRVVSPRFRFLAGVYKCKRIPLPARQQLGGKRAGARRLEDSLRLLRQRLVARMLADTAKPILRIAVVRLAAVENGMDATGARRFHRLDDFVRGLEVIVPEQYQPARGPAVRVRRWLNCERGINRALQGLKRLDTRARTGAELRRFERGQKAGEWVGWLHSTTESPNYALLPGAFNTDFEVENGRGLGCARPARRAILSP